MMNSIKILHFADSHLGSTFPGLGKKGKQRAEEIFHSFRRILAYAKKENTNIILIAGDFLETSSISDREVKLIKEALLNLQETRVFISPGNHDYFSVASVYEGGWPSNVYIFKKELEIVDLPELNTAVVGSAFLASHQRTSVLDELLLSPKDYISQLQQLKDEGRFILGNFHGESLPANQESLYNPLDLHRLPNKLFDYIAFGHIHKRTEIQTINGNAFAYSGNPDGTSFDGGGKKGVYAGAISKLGLDLSFRPFSSRVFLTVTVDVSDYYSQQEMEESIISNLEEKIENTEDNYYRILLRGHKKKDSYWSIADLKNFLKDKLYYVEVIDESQWAVDWADILADDSLEGNFLRALVEKKERVEGEGRDQDRKRRVIERAINLGLKALSGGQ